MALAMTLSLAACGASSSGSGSSSAPAASTSAPAASSSAASASSEAKIAPHKFVFQCVGTEQGTDYITGKAFADALLDASGGALEVKVYGTDQLAGGNTNKALEMLATGEVDIGCYAQSVCANINSKIGICTLPWTFTSYADVNEKMAGAAGDYLKEQFAAVGIEWIDYTHNAMRQLSNSKRPVTTPEDLKNLKIRVPGGNVFMDTWNALGADVTSMAWSEVFTALQQGTIDGQENGAKTSQSNSIQEVNKYWTVWNYAYDGYPLLFNKKCWDSLDATQQQLIRDVAAEVYAASRKQVEEQEDLIWKSFEDDYDCEIVYLDDAQIAAFQEMVRPVVEKYKEAYGKEAYEAFGIAW